MLVVTVHLIGDSRVTTLDSLDYENLKRSVLQDHPDLFGKLPDFSQFQMWLTYRENKNTPARSRIEITPGCKEFPRIQSKWLDASLFFAIEVVVRNAGTKSALFKEVYNSNASVDAFVGSLNMTVAKHAKGRTMETACCDANNVPFSVTHFLDPLESQKVYYVVPDQSSYSHATIQLLLTKVDFPAQVHNSILESGHKRKTGEKTKYLDAFAASLPMETPINTAMKRVKETLDSEKWSARVTACVENLALLNRHVASADCHSKSARRLLINEVVKQVIAYTGGTFYVEEPQNSSRGTDQKYLGWGPLDYMIATEMLDIVVDSVIDESEAGGDDEPQVSQSVADRSVYTKLDQDFPEEEGTSSTNPQPVGASSSAETIEEAKVVLDDGGLAQGGCQTHDRLEGHPDKTRVALLLSTGHRWLHFVLQRGAVGASTKPMLYYFGEASMRVLRSNDGSSARSTGKSCRYSDEYVVDRKEIEDVMLALLCSMRQELHPEQIATGPVGVSGVKADPPAIGSSSSAGVNAEVL